MTISKDPSEVLGIAWEVIVNALGLAFAGTASEPGRAKHLRGQLDQSMFITIAFKKIRRPRDKSRHVEVVGPTDAMVHVHIVKAPGSKAR